MTVASRIAAINEHRIATDHAPIGNTVSLDEIEHHENLIAKNAPMGNDPWSQQSPEQNSDPAFFRTMDADELYDSESQYARICEVRCPNQEYVQFFVDDGQIAMVWGTASECERGYYITFPGKKAGEIYQAFERMPINRLFAMLQLGERSH